MFFIQVAMLSNIFMFVILCNQTFFVFPRNKQIFEYHKYRKTKPTQMMQTIWTH